MKRCVKHVYLEGSSMAQAFDMLRPNDLICVVYVNNYLKGKGPMRFDRRVGGADATPMRAATTSSICANPRYLQNDLRTDAWSSAARRWTSRQ